MKIDDSLYAYFWQNPYENNCNTYIIRGEKAILIDPGHLRYVPQLFDQMERDGIHPDEIDLLIVTHSHPDHFEGLEAFIEKPTKITMSLDEERYLQGNGRLLFEMMGQTIPKYRIDFFLKEGELRIKEVELLIYQTPGHSPGSISIYWPQKKTIFTGDLIFYGGVGRTDFIEGDSNLLVKSIERISRLDIELLLAGHGEMVGGRETGRETVLENFEYIRQNIYPYL